MTNTTIKFQKGEKETLKRFYNQLREALTKTYGYGEDNADFEAYRLILKETTKPPKEYLKIFQCIPKDAQEKILKHLGYSSVKAFSETFNQQINIYRQSAFRRNEEEGE